MNLTNSRNVVSWRRK